MVKVCGPLETVPWDYAARVAATRPEGGGDKGSDVAKGYTCNPNQGRG